MTRSLTVKPSSLFLLISFPPQQHHQRLHCSFPRTYLLIRDTWLWKTWQSISSVGVVAALEAPWQHFDPGCHRHVTPAVMRVTAWLLWWSFGGFTWSVSLGPFRLVSHSHFLLFQVILKPLKYFRKTVSLVIRTKLFFCHPEWIHGFKMSLSVQMASKTCMMWASKLHEAPNELFRIKRINWLWRVCVITVPVQYLSISLDLCLHSPTSYRYYKPFTWPLEGHNYWNRTFFLQSQFKIYIPMYISSASMQ